jgi:hypothetical protein
MQLSVLDRLRSRAQDDGNPIAAPDWPELGSPVPRLTISVDEGRCTVRFNRAWRDLVRSTSAPEPSLQR